MPQRLKTITARLLTVVYLTVMAAGQGLHVWSCCDLACTEDHRRHDTDDPAKVSGSAAVEPASHDRHNAAECFICRFCQQGQVAAVIAGSPGCELLRVELSHCELVSKATPWPHLYSPRGPPATSAPCHNGSPTAQMDCSRKAQHWLRPVRPSRWGRALTRHGRSCLPSR